VPATPTLDIHRRRPPLLRLDTWSSVPELRKRHAVLLDSRCRLVRGTASRRERPEG